MSLMSSGEALEIITGVAMGPPAVVPVWLWDAVGHVLAEDVVTGRDIPPFDRSAMDGYAVRTADMIDGLRDLQVVAVREAGDMGEVAIGKGQCVKIMTGAAVPGDADAVVMIEKTESDEPARHTRILEKGVRGYQNIARRGEDAPAGSVVLKAGTLLTGQALSVAAGAGMSMLKVRQKPLVSLLQTGGELVEPGEVVTGNKIYNSNTTLLTGLLHDTGLSRCRYLGTSPDEKKRLAELIRTGLMGDVLILTGGISKGDYDYVPEVLASCGVEILIHGVKIKPGKPLLFGRTAEGHFVFGLPGNPVSVMVCFYEYVLPLLKKLAGLSEGALPAVVLVKVDRALRKKTGRQFNCPARFYYESGQLMAEPITGHGSGDYVAAAGVNGVLILDIQCGDVAAGQEVNGHVWSVPL